MPRLGYQHEGAGINEAKTLPSVVQWRMKNDAKPIGVVSFNALRLLAWRQERHLACKNCATFGSPK